jgi:hypothetical protein
MSGQPAQTSLAALAARWRPRILTQLDRDPTSSTYGCADRNWWHYKIRDFPSTILQQAGYTVWLEAENEADTAVRESMRRLAAASVCFWAQRAVRHGAFEEYYPWEQGYPPLAFSTLAAMKLAGAGAVPPETLAAAAAVAARQLLDRFEAQAANQQVAGLAALHVLRQVFPALVPSGQLAVLTDRTLALQHAEGWYEEYGGPDLGYLSVTVDCLLDAVDAGGDVRLRVSAEAAVRYIEQMTRITGTNMGMHNARNTDYIVPYGIARLAVEGLPEAAVLIDRLFAGADAPGHFFAATDDRYICHYIGHSVVRAVRVLEHGGALADSADLPDGEAYFPGSGHVLAPHVLVSLRKGGIVTVRGGDGACASDFGWTMAVNEERWVTHWWSDHWCIARHDDGTWDVSGAMVPCREHLSGPFKHAALRVASLGLGRRLIGWLKRALIFKKRLAPARFRRVIRLMPDGVDLDDRIEGLPAGVEPEPAPRASKRHVASADSAHWEDAARACGGARITREVGRDGTAWTARTTLRIKRRNDGRSS